MGRIDIDCEENEYRRKEQTVRKPGNEEGGQYDGTGAQTAVLAPHEATLVDTTSGPQTTTDLFYMTQQTISRGSALMEPEPIKL